MADAATLDNALAVAPYFDVLFQRLQEGDPQMQAAFGRHVHWGYWAEPDKADGTHEDYGQAAERMCRKVCDTAGIADGMRILDVGCGLGGTIASLNERFANLDLVGVNIDARQLAWAEKKVQPANGNRIRWVEGDACQLAYSAEFDVVLAVECIFHFPSRRDFFQGAARALVPGGRLVVSDLIPPLDLAGFMARRKQRDVEDERLSYGQLDLTCPVEQYQTLATETGLTFGGAEDITTGTLPTYPFLLSRIRSWPDARLAECHTRSTQRLELAARMGVLCYTILNFARP